MNLESKRLRLRPWNVNDAKCLYGYAKDPLVGPAAGWPIHTSEENSREIIEKVLRAPGTYAVVLKDDDGEAIGSVGLMDQATSNLGIQENELEVGYWLAVPFWGQGLIPEAVRLLQQYAFEELQVTTLWCCYYDGNEKSKRVQEKCGFIYQRTDTGVYCSQIQETRDAHVTRLTREEWLATRQQ